MSKSKIFLFFCLSFLAGVFFSSFLLARIGYAEGVAGGPARLCLPFILSAGLLAVVLIAVFWPRKRFVIVGFCLIFLAIGLWRYEAHQQKIFFGPYRQLAQQNTAPTIKGIIIKEPAISGSYAKLLIKTDNNEKISVMTDRWPEYHYGDRIKISGVIGLPASDAGFDYSRYLMKEGVAGVMSWPIIEGLGENQGNPIYGSLLRLKSRMRQSFEQNLSPPQSSLLTAIILGDERPVSAEWKNILNISGIRHITSVSGMHIVIFSDILMGLGLAIGLWRGQAFYLALIALWLFIIMVGAPAPAIRAGVMGGLLLLGQKIGRENVAGRAVVMAAAFMVFQNPALLRGDIGFQLSFLATLGIIYLGPIFRSRIAVITGRNFLSELLAMTFSAQIFTLPILIYNFGYFSLVAPLANILVVPLLSAVMAAGFALGLTGMIWQTLAWLVSLPAWALMTYFLRVAEYASKIPMASISLKISWPWFFAAYAVIGAFTAWLWRREKERFL
ncbi:MAG: ComEC/Rec2 family competence protein [Patescibacteria group bacterium]